MHRPESDTNPLTPKTQCLRAPQTGRGVVRPASVQCLIALLETLKTVPASRVHELQQQAKVHACGAATAQMRAACTAVGLLWGYSTHHMSSPAGCSHIVCASQNQVAADFSHTDFTQGTAVRPGVHKLRMAVTHCTSVAAQWVRRMLVAAKPQPSRVLQHTHTVHQMQRGHMCRPQCRTYFPVGRCQALGANRPALPDDWHTSRKPKE